MAQPFDSADRDLLTATSRPMVDGGSLTNPVQPLKGVNAAIAEGVRSLDVRLDDPAGRVGMAPAAGSAGRWFDVLLNRSDDSSPVSSVGVGVVPLDVELRDLVDHAEYVPEPVSIAWVVLGVIPFLRRSARRGHV